MQMKCQSCEQQEQLVSDLRAAIHVRDTIIADLTLKLADARSALAEAEYNTRAKQEIIELACKPSICKLLEEIESGGTAQ